MQDKDKITNFTVGNKDLDPVAAAPGISGRSLEVGDQGGMVVQPDHPMFLPQRHPQQPSQSANGVINLQRPAPFTGSSHSEDPRLLSGVPFPGHSEMNPIFGPQNPFISPSIGRHPQFPQGIHPSFPAGAIPPGARFDPVGPFGPRPGGFNRPSRNGQGSGTPFSGDPDFDELLPPGYDPCQF